MSDKQPEAIVTRSAVQIAEIESQIATAKMYPRDIALFKEKLMSMANLDQETAEGCYYAIPRAGGVIDGPSIRLAEIALSCWGNCAAEAEVLNDDGRFIHAVGRCRDLENNVAISVKIQRKITNKQGKRFSDDMIAVTANAACSIALRNSIFDIVPRAYVNPVFRRCKQTAVGEYRSLAVKCAEVLKKLKQFGVTDDRVLNVLDKSSIEDITFDDIANLIGIGSAIKDGEIAVEEAFPLDFKDTQKEAVKDIKNKAGSEAVNIVFENEETPPEPTAEPPKEPTTNTRKKPAFMYDDEN